MLSLVFDIVHNYHVKLLKPLLDAHRAHNLVLLCLSPHSPHFVPLRMCIETDADLLLTNATSTVWTNFFLLSKPDFVGGGNQIGS